ncbi:alpha/beta fold hydrolase [Rhodospirillaceae bacterium KN72]|uniref:Alpha/beta fold hydrolase n=1 Tax=Pacificispira spongiicola TaxID=2729598 RepID=A0A7Y0DXC3_9PROT|nr:alpha/beta hydrolase [Pacificispira spongiicola]NMM43316.1 alpha/beta fold hydrolase [Pacificispira spongiicola]
MSNTIECAYTVEGDGPPLFLIHGIGAARDTWRYLMPTLRQHFTVVSYDLRGHGASPLPDAPFGLDELVSDLEWVRAQTGIEQAHFAGHSLGGMIGPAYARKYPDRVLSLGLLSTAAFRTEDDSKKVWGVVKAMEDKGIPNILPTLTDRWYTDAFIEQHPEIVQRRLKQVIDTDPEIFMNVFRIYAGVEMGPWLHEIDHPSLVLTGENDGGCNPRLNKQIADAMPNAELVILPGYKHSILLETGETVADHIVRFVERLG